MALTILTRLSLFTSQADHRSSIATIIPKKLFCVATFSCCAMPKQLSLDFKEMSDGSFPKERKSLGRRENFFFPLKLFIKQMSILMILTDKIQSSYLPDLRSPFSTVKSTRDFPTFFPMAYDYQPFNRKILSLECLLNTLLVVLQESVCRSPELTPLRNFMENQVGTLVIFSLHFCADDLHCS